MTSWLNDWTQEGKHLSKESVLLRKSESKSRDQVSPELRDRHSCCSEDSQELSGLISLDQKWHLLSDKLQVEDTGLGS